MYTLSSADLSISILDPVADANRLGSRYCTGGYIWQVSDAHKGLLLSGPEYPLEPNTFDGQGMPEMFHRALGAEDAAVGDAVGCIGVGSVRRTSPSQPFDVRLNREVIQFVTWQVEVGSDAVMMRTRQTFHNWSFDLERQVTLHERTVTSRTGLHNLGAEALPIRWFPHPFFPIPMNNVLCAFSFPVSMPENPGYFTNEQGFIARKPGHDWQRGWYQVLDYAQVGNSMGAVQEHPVVGQVKVTTDYMPAFLPIWGNANTFSFEPYYERLLPTGESAAWSISYQF